MILERQEDKFEIVTDIDQFMKDRAINAILENQYFYSVGC